MTVFITESLKKQGINDHIEAFKQAMINAGMPSVPDSIEITGAKIPRWKDPQGESGNKDCWYRFGINPDGSGFGKFSNHKGIKDKWHSSYEKGLSKIQFNQKEKEQLAVLNTEAEKAESALKKGKRKKACALFEKGRLVTALKKLHWYIKEKQISAFEDLKQERSTLLIPCYSGNNELLAVQRIYRDNTGKTQKRFLGSYSGGFFTIGQIKPDGLCYLTEGYATGATVHEATRAPVIVAFSCRNLIFVAEIIRKKYPNTKIINVADNDLKKAKQDNKKNSGLNMAKELLRKLNIPYALSPMDSDFNDYFVQVLQETNDEKLAYTKVRKALENIQTPEAGKTADITIDINKKIQAIWNAIEQAKNKEKKELYQDDIISHINFIKRKKPTEFARIRIALKDIQGIHIIEYEKMLEAERNLELYGDSEEAINKLNKDYAVVQNKGKVLILQETTEPQKKWKEENLLSFNDFKNLLSNKKIPDSENPNKLKQLANVWLDWPKRRQYDGIVFDPSEKTQNNYYNLWKGFVIKPEQGECGYLNDHILEIIANGNNDRYKWLMSWFAAIVQRPWKKQIVCPVFTSGEGTGKDTLINNFGKILGRHYAFISNPTHLIGRFNGHTASTLLVYGNEVSWGGDIQKAGIIKSLITDPFRNIEYKGKDVFQIENLINLVLSSNNDWIVPAGIDSRRFYIFEVSEKKKQQTDYFKKIYEEMNNGGLEAFFYKLLQWDYKQVDLRTIERNEGLLNQIIRSFKPIQRYWFERLENGHLISAKYEQDNKTIKESPLEWNNPIKVNQQYNDFLDFCIENGIKQYENRHAMGKYFNKLYESELKTEKQTIDPAIGQERVRIFPDLKTARKIFCNTMKMDTEMVFPDK